MPVRRTSSDHKEGQLTLKQRQKHKRRSIEVESSEKYGYIPTVKFIRQKGIERDRRSKEDGDLGQVSVSSPSLDSISRKAEKVGKKSDHRSPSVVKNGASHSDRLKKLYVGSNSDIKIEIPSSATVPKPFASLPRKAAAAAAAVASSSPSSSGIAGIHENFQRKGNGSPFQKNSRPMSANRLARQTRTLKNVNFAFETSLNEVDLNLLSKARASSSEGGGISKSGTPVPVASPSQTRASPRAPVSTQVKRTPSELKQPSEFLKNASEAKDLSSLLSSRLKMRKTLFNNKGAGIEKQADNSATGNLDTLVTNGCTERNENIESDPKLTPKNSPQKTHSQDVSQQATQQTPQLDLTTVNTPQGNSDTNSLSLLNETENKGIDQKSENLHVVEKNDTDASPEPELSLVTGESKLREEAGKLVELSDSSSDSSSESPSTDNASGHEVDDFQLLNSIRTRMVGPKVNKWKKFDKQKLTELMDYLVADHTPLSTRPTVSCSNDICNAKNYESVEVHHLQKLPQRLKFIDLEALTTNSTEKTPKTNNRVEKPRKNSSHNRVVQKRRTRASQIGLEETKRTNPLEEQPLENAVLIEPSVDKVLNPMETIPDTDDHMEIHQEKKKTAPPTSEDKPQLNIQETLEAKPDDSPTLETELPQSLSGSKTDNGISESCGVHDSSHEKVHDDEISPNSSQFDAAKCTDIEEIRREYIKLQNSMNDNAEKLAEASTVNMDKTLVIEKLTHEIMQSEMRYASLVGKNHQLQEKVKMMNSLQIKLMHELELAAAESGPSEEEISRSNDSNTSTSNVVATLQNKHPNVVEKTTKATDSISTSELPSEAAIDEFLSLTLLTHKASSKFPSDNLPENVRTEIGNLNQKLALISFFLARIRNSNDNIKNKSQILVANYDDVTNASSALKQDCANFAQYAGSIQHVLSPHVREKDGETGMNSSGEINSVELAKKASLGDEESHNWREENTKARERIKQLEDKIESMTKALEEEAKKGIYYKQLEDYISPVVNYCSEKNITIRILMEKLSWINKMELAIVRLSKERDFYLKRVKDIEAANANPPSSHTEAENTRLKEAILRLHNERKKLLEVLAKKEKQDKKQTPSENVKQGHIHNESQNPNQLKIVYVDRDEYGKQSRKKNRNKNKNKNTHNNKKDEDENREEQSSTG